MISPRSAALSARTCSILCLTASTHSFGACSSASLGAKCMAVSIDTARHPLAELQKRSRSIRAHIRTHFVGATSSSSSSIYRAAAFTTSCSGLCSSCHPPPTLCSHRSGSLRYFSSSSSSGGGGGGGVSGGVAGTRSDSAGHDSADASRGRFQEEVAQSSDHDSTRIDLRQFISSPSDLKGLHETLQSASRSSGDKEIMTMTIDDIQNILKGEFRRRRAQAASVEIWKALGVVAGLVSILYWGRIGKDIASETAKVTTLTLQDEQLQAKAFELANVIVRTLCHPPITMQLFTRAISGE